MSEDQNQKSEAESSKFEKIIQERERLDRILRQKFRKEVAILFTDICGYTKYIDTRGDISGRTMLLNHNRIVLPLIEKHRGKIIEIIGDAVMAAFSTPLAAVKASIEVQEALQEYNKNVEPMDRIYLKMGIHVGKALVDESSFYQSLTGDVANVASRIQSKADRNQILISKALYEKVCGSEDILCRFYKTIQVKGKAESLEIYQVVWQDKDVTLETKAKVRHYESLIEKKEKSTLKLFQLEIALHTNHLKLGAYENVAGEECSIRHYDEQKVAMDMIRKKCLEIVHTLNKTSRKGCVTHEGIMKLREIGQVFYDELFSMWVKEKLKNTKAEYLSLKIDDQLVQIPWELLNDGQQFLCQRFNMGRLIKTRQHVLGGKTRILAKPLRMLILADPEGDLKGAYAEGTQIRDYMDMDKYLINAFFCSDNITIDSIKGKLRNFDFIHFAGHADYNSKDAGDSGWRLSTGSLKAKDIIKMAGTSSMPTLIFSNACQSARTEDWRLREFFEDEIFGLANAFLLTGVRHYIGTFWEILDEPSRRFALLFYKHLLSGKTIGEAMRQARLTLIKEYGEDNIIWASYVLYGDPTFNYMEQIEKTEPKVHQEHSKIPVIEKEVRAREEVIDFSNKKAVKKSIRWLSAGVGLALILALMLWGYTGVLKNRTIKYEKAAFSFYSEGNFPEALKLCKILKGKNLKVSGPYLLEGNIHLFNGKLDLAKASFKKALAAQKGTNIQKAQALIGLGRIASINKNTDEAFNYYQQVSEMAPYNSQGYLSQALILEGQGNYNKALDLLEKAETFSSQDKVLRAITNETLRKVEITRDQEKKERIDRIVKELLESMDSQSVSLSSDGWTSRPLTLWVMDFDVQGYSLQEGQERLLTSGITAQMLQYSRSKIVERALFDKMTEELKLGNSKLVDRNTMLSLGRMLAARLILSGQSVYSGPQVQVSIRLVETETGQIVAAINESFGSAVPAQVMAEKLSKDILEKLKDLYPLRGKISEVKNRYVTLNIGQMSGVKKGQRFEVVDKNMILEVTSLKKDSSIAKVVEGKETLDEEMRVEAL